MVRGSSATIKSFLTTFLQQVLLVLLLLLFLLAFGGGEASCRRAPLRARITARQACLLELARRDLNRLEGRFVVQISHGIGSLHILVLLALPFRARLLVFDNVVHR